jgi:putrescine---pyruvate transaminase
MVDVSDPIDDGVTAGLRGYWPPMTSLRTRADEQILIVRGEGARVWDDQGREFLDATASLSYANVGHGRERIAAAVADQLRVLAAYSNFGRFATEPTLRLTERIAGLAPLDDPLVFLTSGGSDAVDSAVKIVRRYWTLRDKPTKVGMISRQRSYHGMHGFGTALAGIEANAAGYGEPTEGGFVHTPVNDVAAVRAQIEEFGAERLGAVFAEPVIGAGGIEPPTDKYLNELRDVCDQYELLFVADEVVTGFGRLGTWFGCERFDVRPDLLLFAKGVTSGYLPLGGVIASRRIWEAFYADGSMFRHGYTYSGHAAACVAAITNLDIIVEEDLLGRVRELEPALATSFAPLADHRLVAEVRSVGLLTAIQLNTNDLKTLDQVVGRAREHGVLTRGLTGGAIQISPPFTITEDQLATMAGALKNSLDDVADATP